jgi:hypothetical protein
VGRKKLRPPPGISEPTPRPPWRSAVSMNKVESVTICSGGGLVISGRTGAREIAVEIPKSEVNALLAGSRWPISSTKNPDDDLPSPQLELF